MSPIKIYKNHEIIFKRQLLTNWMTIIDNSKGIFCLGWKSDTSLATQSKMIKGG